MAKLVTCPTGLHPYDSERYKVCPYCGSSPRTTTQRAAEPPLGEQQTDLLIWPSDLVNTPAADAPAPVPTQEPAPTEYHRSIKGGARTVYGWLVVTAGPGRGSSLCVFAGTNSIGRGEDQDIRLRFPDGEDTEIGRSSHALLRVDPRTLRFAIAHKDGKNLTYLNDSPIFEPFRLLNAYDRIRIGRTTLMFVPLCGEHFRWDEGNA